jgi:hypothetical protein
MIYLLTIQEFPCVDKVEVEKAMSILEVNPALYMRIFGVY